MSFVSIIRKRIIEVLSIFIAIVALGSLASWVFDSWHILTWGRDYNPIAPLTAVLFFLLSLSTLLPCFNQKHRTVKIAINILPLITLGIGCLILIDHIFSLNMGFENRLIPISMQKDSFVLSRMSPVTAYAFIMTSIAAILLHSRLHKRFIFRQIAVVLSILTIALSFTILFSYLTGLPLFYGLLKIPVAFITALLFFLMNMALLFKAEDDVWPHSIFSLKAGSVHSSAYDFRVGIITAFSFFALAVGITAMLYLRSETRNFKTSIREQLESISELKEKQITWWITERRNDAEVLKTNIFLQKEAQKLISGTATATEKKELQDVMTSYILNYDNCSYGLFDPRGRLYSAYPSNISFQDITAYPDFKRAIQTGETVFSDLNYDTLTIGLKDHDIHLRFWIPIVSKSDPQQTIRGMWLIQIDPGKFLYPLIQSWPTPSKSAETLLIRLEGNDVVYLNELRHQKDSSIKLRKSVNQNPNLPAAKATKGYEGAFEGVDYRGIPVLSVIRNIKVNDWYLISKVDLDEIYAPLRIKGWQTGGAFAFLFLISSYIIGMLIKRRGDAEGLRLAKEWKTTFDAVNDVIWLLDRDYKIARANAATRDWFSLSSEEVVGSYCWEIVHNSESPHQDCPFNLMLDTGQRAEAEIQLIDRWALVTLDPIMDSKQQIIGVVHSIRDITIQKTAQAEIQALNESLEERVRVRTAQLEASNKELEAFSYSVSHDLRAPLRAIDGWSMVLLEDYGDELSVHAKQHFERTRSEIQKMGHLIDTLIQLSRVTRIDMSMHKTNLSQIARDIYERLMQENPQRNVSIRIEPGIIVSADSNLMEIVLNNLLSNAFKFTSKLKRAQIEFGKSMLDKNECYFIRDNGVGFDMKYIDKLFGTFQRLHKSTEFVGTGIGLAMVKRIINRHGGNVWAESVPNEYTVFYFTLREE